MELYSDLSFKDPVSIIISEERVEVGTTFRRTYFLKNESPDWPMANITFENDDPDLNIIHPDRIEANGSAKVEVVFSPKLTRRKPLMQPVLINGDLLIG